MYKHQEIEPKWQAFWEKNQVYKTKEEATRPKYYILDMFPYPSGSGLHVGHPKGYIATDVLARLKMMQGYNVLHPMGFDAFGLPAENYAIKNKVHPKTCTAENVATYKKQLQLLGLSYDWAREVNTTDPEYYKWTQWIFLKMFEKGLAYESYEPINWCPSCKTGLANEDLEDGKCERCGSEIEQRPMRQWVLRIKDYADRLLDDLEKLPEWEEAIKEMQRNWIGRSYGAEAIFKITGVEGKEIKVFTTRIDTIFGCTYVVLAPENNLILELKEQIQNWPEVEEYIEKVKHKSALERTDLNKDKTGVLLKGLKAINPFNGQEVEIFAADYVLNSYGTGAVMAVPAHDERDFAFAKKYNLPIKLSIKPLEGEVSQEEAYTPDGILVDSGEFSDFKSEEAREKMSAWLEQNNLGTKKINYKIQNWVFSRQRYWGEPIPVIHCDKCGAVGVPEKDLPVLLPEVESYEPSGTGESPLANIASWVNTTCPKCGGLAKRETNTMPQWAGSSWYYLRYIDPSNKEVLVDKAKEKYWSPVDFYVGGAEHATRHLIYARFWHKFLFDIGVVNYEEPFKKLQHVGLIMGEDGRKMSKRWGNVINPDEIVRDFGADALRVYEMFMGPFDAQVSWSTNGLIGARKFLERIFNLQVGGEDRTEVISLLHKTIKKVSEDIEAFKFNTAISAMMILVNKIYEMQKQGESASLSKDNFILLIKILSPFAPHLAEELWFSLGEKESILSQAWPEYNPDLAKDEKITLVVQINGKMRASLEVPADISEEEAKALALAEENIQKWLVGKEIIKVIFARGKLLNLVIK